jgi:hypothetical protein
LRPSVKSDKTKEACDTEDRDEHTEDRNSGGEGEEKIRVIDISSANLDIEYMDQTGKESEYRKMTHNEGMEVGQIVSHKEPGITCQSETRCYAAGSNYASCMCIDHE